MKLKQISKELNYRENAGEDCRWNDDLFEYSSEELEILEKIIDAKKNYSHEEFESILE